MATIRVSSNDWTEVLETVRRTQPEDTIIVDNETTLNLAQKAKSHLGRSDLKIEFRKVELTKTSPSPDFRPRCPGCGFPISGGYCPVCGRSSKPWDSIFGSRRNNYWDDDWKSNLDKPYNQAALRARKETTRT